MRFFTKHVVLIAVQLLVVTGIKAEGIFSSSEGTNYLWFNGTKSSTNYAYLVACQNSDRPYVGDVVIPESVTEWIWPDDIVGSVVGGVYTVTGIDAGAFVGCTEVKTITIPSTVTGNIEGSFFSGCTSLTAINVDPENTQYSSIDGVLYNKDQTELIRVPETRTSIVIPNTVRTIGASAFSGCTKLTSVEMPMVTTIEENAFSNCTGLTSIEFPTTLNSIGDRAFKGCTGLTSVVIPRYVRNLWSSSFEECTNLKTAVVYSSNTGFAFTNAEEVYYLFPDAIISDASTVESFTGTIYGTQQVLDQFTSPDIQKVKLYALKKEAMLGAVTLTFDSICSKLQLGEVLLNEDSDDLEIKVERKDNEYKIGGLLPGWTFTILINALFNGEPVTLPIKIETQTPVIPIPTIIKRYQTKIVMNISAPVDESFPVVELRIFGETIKDYKGGTQRVVLRNLIPGKDDYSFSVSAYYGDYPWNYAYFYSKPVKCSTLPVLSTAPSVVSLTPTTVEVSATYLEGDAHVTEVGFSKFYRNNRVDPYNELGTSGLEIYEEDGNTILETSGLKPGQQHWGWFYVTTKEGGKDSIGYKFTTPALEFETLPAKATSNTVALICAETNLSDRETGAGFEWRRYDAPDLVPSTKSPCPVVDGVLTGALRNLSASTYYKFRPYYTSASGETYYGEWLAFGTADAYVYFDPTVRTYEATGVTATEARVRGYAIAGSDDITEQGFEYWPTEAASKRAATDVQRVQATGQFMTATLEDLQPGTVYTFRVYVETAKGTTYGEEQTFTTAEGATGISTTETEADSDLQVAVRGSMSEGSASVHVNGNGGEAVWTLRSIGGATVAQGRIQADGSWQMLDAPALPRGIYLLTVSDGQRTRTVKLVAH